MKYKLRDLIFAANRVEVDENRMDGWSRGVIDSQRVIILEALGYLDWYFVEDQEVELDLEGVCRAVCFKKTPGRNTLEVRIRFVMERPLGHPDMTEYLSTVVPEEPFMYDAII